MTVTTIARRSGAPTRRSAPAGTPVGNSGREYHITGGGWPFPVGISVKRGASFLTSAHDGLSARHARTLGLQLIECAALAEVIDSGHPAHEYVTAMGGRRYSVELRSADRSGTSALLGQRRIRLLVHSSSGGRLPTLCDMFTPADARGLGLHLISAAAIADAEHENTERP